jgi:hypothetical protein
LQWRPYTDSDPAVLLVGTGYTSTAASANQVISAGFGT